MAKGKKNKEGFRRTPEEEKADAEARRAAREAARHTTAAELDQVRAEVDRLSKLVSRAWAVAERYKLRPEAVIKTLVDAGVMSEAAFDSNYKGLRRLQAFVAGLDAQEAMSMDDKVDAAADYNAKTEDPGFHMTDAHFPVRPWLTKAPDLAPERVIAVARAFGFSDDDVEQILVDRAVAEEYERARTERGEAVPAPLSVVK